MSKNKNQAPFSRRPAHAVASRRSFIRGTMGVTGTGLVLGSGLWTPTLANSVGTNVRDPRFRAPALSGKPGPGEPTPIPSVFFFPGPPDSSDPAVGHDPSVINNFNGFVGVAELSLTGTGTDTTTGDTAPYTFDADMRFMLGEFVGADGRNHRGAFAFI